LLDKIYIFEVKKAAERQASKNCVQMKELELQSMKQELEVKLEVER